MRLIPFLISSVILLSACVPEDTQSVQMPPKAPVARKTSAQAIADYARVAKRVEPVAEATCRSLNKNENATFCNFSLKIVNDPKQPPNAFQSQGSDGRPIIAFNINLLRTIQNDDEIAFILGHEAGHQIASHLVKTRGNTMAGAILGGILVTIAGGDVNLGMDIGATFGQRAYSQDFELQADTIGTHIAYRAGYNPERGAQYFNRIDSASGILSTHPPSQRRINTVNATAARIRAARSQGFTAPVVW